MTFTKDQRSALLSTTALLLALVPASHALAEDKVPKADEVIVSASRINVGLAGASTTTIGADEIKKSPARTLPELLSQEAGVQSRDLYGNGGGTRASIDMRGFGASGDQNTLILVNGRRLNEIDLTNVDFAGIPLDSIQRIEIIRGGAGAVLYGDNAVGGSINIITKSPAALKPGSHLETGIGSDHYFETNGSTVQQAGAFSASAYGTYIDSHGYRDNNRLIERDVVTEVRHTAENGDIFAKLLLNDQSLGLPGGRIVDPTKRINLLFTDRRGTPNPRDHGHQSEVAPTLGITRQLNDNLQLIVDGGVRLRDQQADFVSSTSAVHTTLHTWSLTPRLDADYSLFGLRSNSVTGIDYYYTDYNSDRSNSRINTPIHQYNGDQQTVGAYVQNTVSLTERTDLSLGFREQWQEFVAGEAYNASAPGASPAFDVVQRPIDDRQHHYAANLGLDQRLTDTVSVFGRLARSFRSPTVDERIGTGAVRFDLQTQTSRDAEIGARYVDPMFSLETSVYAMWLHNEIHFTPDTFTNVNLPPTRRTGVENSATVKVTKEVRLKASAGYKDSEFAGGANKGNNVPLVSHWTGSLGGYWDIMPNLTFGATARYVSAMRMDNDQVNGVGNGAAPIPAYTLVDLRLAGEIGAFNWSAAVNNLFDKDYFNYAAASTSTNGRYSAFPLPGRTFMVRAGVTF